MTKTRLIRVSFVLLAVCALVAVLNSAGIAVRAKNEPSAPPNVRITPPAPVFDDKERLAELAQRRERVAQAIGPQSFLILFSTEPRVEVDPEHVEPPDVPRPPNGRRPNQPGKMETQVLPGGVIIRKFPNGSQIISMSDGTRIFVSPEGTRTTIPPKNRQNRRPPQAAPSP